MKLSSMLPYHFVIILSAKMLQFLLMSLLFRIADLSPISDDFADQVPITSNASALLKDGLAEVVSVFFLQFKIIETKRHN